MQNLTIERLNEIISLMDLEKIKTEIEKAGYRCASKHGKFEFDLIEIIKNERTTATDDYEDTFDDYSYFAEVYDGIKGYEEYTFIAVTQLQIYRDRNNFEFPSHIDLYTNVPINEEYEKSMEKIKKCKDCGKKFKTYDIHSLNGKEYCKDCFHKNLQKSIFQRKK